MIVSNACFVDEVQWKTIYLWPIATFATCFGNLIDTNLVNCDISLIAGRAKVELLDSAQQLVVIDDLVVVAEFKDFIYPGLVSTGKVNRGGDKPFHTAQRRH